MDYRKVACVVLALLAAAASICFWPAAGPGMTLQYTCAIRDTTVYIESGRLPDGAAFPVAGVVGCMDKPNENPLAAGATMGAAPDGRALPEFVDFTWRELPAASDREAGTIVDVPVRRQRVFVRDRVPPALVRAAAEANRHTASDQLDPASIILWFIWTDHGIRLRWAIWHRPGVQYYSHQGGDDIVPARTTMIATYSNTIKDDKYEVGLADSFPTRYPAAAGGGTAFSGATGFAYTSRPISGGEQLAAFESEPELPAWIDFRWALFPTSVIAHKSGESEPAYYRRSLAIYGAVPRKSERILVRSRIPQEVRDEITAATRNAQTDKVVRSIIYLYFVWTDSGIKLHWRLKRSRPDGIFITVREGGDELPQAAVL